MLNESIMDLKYVRILKTGYRRMPNIVRFVVELL